MTGSVKLVKIIRSTGDDAYWDAIALNLQGFYSGVERVFEDVARTSENYPTI